MTTINRANEHNVHQTDQRSVTDLEASVFGHRNRRCKHRCARCHALEANICYTLFVQTPEFDPADSTTYFAGLNRAIDYWRRTPIACSSRRNDHALM